MSGHVNFLISRTRETKSDGKILTTCQRDFETLDKIVRLHLCENPSIHNLRYPTPFSWHRIFRSNFWAMSFKCRYLVFESPVRSGYLGAEIDGPQQARPLVASPLFSILWNLIFPLWSQYPMLWHMQNIYWWLIPIILVNISFVLGTPFNYPTPWHKICFPFGD